MGNCSDAFVVEELKSSDGFSVVYIEKFGGEVYLDARGWLSPEIAKALVLSLSRSLAFEEAESNELLTSG